MVLSTPAIQAKHALGRASAGDYIDWAASALESGADSRHLRILAGFDRLGSFFEAGEYFTKARLELGLATPDRDQALRDYAVHLAQAILEPDSDYPKIVAQLAELCWANDYPGYLADWYSLDDGLTNALAGEYPWGYEALYQADPREVVTHVAREFIDQQR
jgi:hypothetical protein